MRKISGKGILEQYDQTSGRFTGIIESKARVALEAMREFVGDKMWSFSFGRFYDRRSTGKDSQNHKIWGDCQAYAVATGVDIETVHTMAKLMAISWGYPFDIVEMDADGEKKVIKIPWSETRADTRQAGILIDCLAWMCCEVGADVYEGEEDGD